MFIAVLLIGILSSCKKDENTQYELTNGIITENFTISSWSWSPTYNSQGGQMGIKYTHNTSQITADLLNNGAVLVYSGSPSTNEWMQLPFTFISTNTIFYTWDAYVKPGSIDIKITESDLSWSSSNPNANFKAVYISNSILKEKNITLEDLKDIRKLQSILEYDLKL